MGRCCSLPIPDNRVNDINHAPKQVSTRSHHTEKAGTEVSLRENVTVPDNTITRIGRKSDSWSWFPKTRSLHMPKTYSLSSPVHSGRRAAESVVQTLQHEHEIFIAAKDKEIERLQTEKNQIEIENSRLGRELKLLQTSVPKLRLQKKKAQTAEKDALERAQVFEQGMIPQGLAPGHLVDTFIFKPTR